MKTETLICLVVACCQLLAEGTAVPRPWTPVTVSNDCVGVWGRSYSFVSNALPTAVTGLGDEVLAGPMRIVCTDGQGEHVIWNKAGSGVLERRDDVVTLYGWQEAKQVTADVAASVEFDGMMKMSLTLVPGPDVHADNVSKIWIEIPFRPSCATLFNFSPASWSRLENAGGVKGPMAWPFRCSVWLGNEKVGLCWFCESDENFSTADRDRVIEVLPLHNETILRIRLADKHVSLPATWTFGLQATPVKPFNRRHNANHTMHSPQMGIGITIKRPEIWWTAQRAFPDGRIDQNLDAAQVAGVKTIVFHEDWIPIQNNPLPNSDFKAIVDGCHRRGMKVLVYQGYELSPLDPLWGGHHDEWLAKTDKGRFEGNWYRAPGQRDYRLCYNNNSATAWLERVKHAYDTLGIDGLYLDGTVMPRACANIRHGCGWTDDKGERHVTYPFFSVRKMMRELYEFVESRGGRIDAHQSGYVCPATLAFVHTYWDGEQLACSRQDIKRMLDLDAFRAEFMGRNHGIACEFLAYEVPGMWSYDDAIALTLLHDVLVRPCGFASVQRLAPIWKVMDDFGCTEAEFVPYWQDNALAVAPASVKASYYRKDGRYLAVVSNLSPDAAVKAELTLPAGILKATDTISKQEVLVRERKAVLDLEPFRVSLLKF